MIFYSLVPCTWNLLHGASWYDRGITGSQILLPSYSLSHWRIFADSFKKILYSKAKAFIPKENDSMQWSLKCSMWQCLAIPLRVGCPGISQHTPSMHSQEATSLSLSLNTVFFTHCPGWFILILQDSAQIPALLGIDYFPLSSLSTWSKPVG